MAGTLRITGGSLARRRFQVPKAADDGLVRPTSDRVREAVFSSLSNSILDTVVLDLFAGSGAYGFEAISRGAKSVLFVEKSRDTGNCIRGNIVTLGVEKSCRLVVEDAIRFVKHKPSQVFDVVFVDPPYTISLEPVFWEHLRPWLHGDTTIVFRCKSQEDFTCPKDYEITRERAYGGTAVFFLCISSAGSLLTK